jgi:hypothetical protein
MPKRATLAKSAKVAQVNHSNARTGKGALLEVRVLLSVVCLQHHPNLLQIKQLLIVNYLLWSKTLLQRRLMKSMAIVMGWKEKVLEHQVSSVELTDVPLFPLLRV